ncbi:tetratricopeptide repeat protein [bacterium]|nr:tetratricopeptide repeat protein [bacterium]QQR56380.1 MAG: tetratricopeptide repeat protein [Candidatus Melainabacteria bacterium]
MRLTLWGTLTAFSILLAYGANTAACAEQKVSKPEANQTKPSVQKATKEKSELQKLADKQKNPAHFDNAFMLQSQNMTSMAIPEYRDALTADPKFVSTYNNLAQCLWDRNGNDGKDREEARELLKKALELEPKNVGTMHVMALVKDADKDSKGAEELYRKILRVQPINFRAVQNLSEMMFRQGRKEDAKKVINTALASSPPETDVAVYKQALANLDKAKPATSPEKTKEAKKKSNEG